MPALALSAQMYGEEYAAFSETHSDELDHRLEAALDALRRLPTGRLIDFGCGSGVFLRAAAALGWDCVGVEFSAEIAMRLSNELQVPVLTPDAMGRYGKQADALVLNDVIEHLTDLPSAFPSIVELVRPEGLLIAQGPLDSNPNLFTHAIAATRRLRRARTASMPPYHVLLATSKGQRAFFQRSGLREVEYTVDEVAWPAPAQLAASVLADPRALGLFLLRRASRAVGRVVPRYSGNRYFYVGAREALPA
jgi:SAM-dependent methyltransferase